MLDRVWVGKWDCMLVPFPILTFLLSQMSGKAQPIEAILDSNIKKEIEENRKKLASIVDSVVFCGRLGLPLHRHRDDVPNTIQRLAVTLQGELVIL